MTEITQADRDAARAYYDEWMEDWTGDDYPAAMFARHGKQAAAEERAKIVAWLRESPHFINAHQIADAIEAGDHELFTRSDDV